MATVNFINTAAPEITRARTVSLTNLQSQGFPIIVANDSRQHQFFFAANGILESFSGANNYSLTLSLGDPTAAPFGGTYTLTCGANTTDALAFNSDAAAIEYALNALASVIAFGGVTVTGSFPDFLIYYNAVNVNTAITANAALLQPDSTVTIAVYTAGTTGVRQQSSLSLRQSALASQTNWTQISSPYAGWQGNLSANTNAVLIALEKNGVTNGGIRELDTILTIAVNYTNANTTTVSTFYQAPVIVRYP